MSESAAKGFPSQWRSASNELRHTVQIIRDGEVELVISKTWAPTRQRWLYQADPIHDALLQIELRQRKDA